MSRSVSVKPTLKEYTTIILAGLTERWYFSHLQSFYNLSRNTYKVSASKLLIPCAINSARFC